MARTKSSSSKVSRDLKKPIDATTNQTTLTAPAASMMSDSDLFSLAHTWTCKTQEETADTVSSLIIDKINYEENNTKLTKQIGAYLTLIGLKIDDILAFMSESSWPIPASLSKIYLNLLTVQVLSMLNKIASYTVRVRKSTFYLTSSITYNGLVEFPHQFPHPARNNACGSGGGNVVASLSTKMKIPSFSTPNFDGDTLGWYTFINKVATKFCSNAHIKYLTNEQFCI